ncbi:MAG: hypothetical protein JNM99_17870 [Verrucomicrobiaceae bacterium]|nr:hypothetical protein [Verrucomicrobiaceae bacterium]
MFSRACFALMVLVGWVRVHAEVRLPAVFSDHAVLQREVEVPVWGWADVGEEVHVSVAGQSASAKAGADGRWMVRLKSLAAGGPHLLKVQGVNTIEVKDVLVGEVWLGSGQSNMAMTVSRAKDYEAEKAKADLPQVRMFTVRSSASSKPVADVQGKWEVCSAETVGGFSATLFFTARELHRELKVPFGLINSSVGGTPIESWIDAGAQHAKAELKGFFEAKNSQVFDEAKAKADYEKQLVAWTEAAKKARAAGQTPPRKPRDPVALRKTKGDVGGLFNGKINGLIPYAIRGALWYQGEANSQPEKSRYYHPHLSLLVENWRKRWGYEFPFAWVQLPNFASRGDAWCEVREGMFQTLSLPHTGMAVTTDIGEEKDIHPKNKQEVGRRLSMWALGAVYGKPVAVSGPRFAGREVKGAEVHLRFTHTDGGLVFKGEPAGFVVADEDQKWQPATARIEGEKVIVTSAAVVKPVAVRYAWADMPPSTLWNNAGLPASPFRTDSWPLHYATEAKAAQTRGPRTIKVACVGDSITEGVGARDPRTGSYPALLQERLGKRYEVRNFGVSARTMLRAGDHPYHKEKAFQDALAFKPDIVTILLGTNDSKPHNWAHKDDFIPSAKEIISAFRAANPQVRIHVCLPVPAFPENFGITDKVIKGEVIPELRKLAAAEKLPVIDLNKTMLGHAEMVSDKVHPNDAGYQLMADVITKALVRKPAAK